MSKSDTEERARDRLRTEEIIIASARTLLIEQGFSAWGVNAIARGAKCDKQLIYRYFGGLEGLAEAIGRQVAAELEDAMMGELGEVPDSYASLVVTMLHAFLDVLRAKPLMQRVIAWEMSDANPLTLGFAKARGEALSRWMARMRGSVQPPQGVDAAAINGLLIAAVQQAVIAASASGAIAGMPLSSEADWKRVKATIARFATLAYQRPDS